MIRSATEVAQEEPDEEIELVLKGFSECKDPDQSIE